MNNNQNFMSYNQNSGYGQALLNMVASQVPAFGRIFIVMDPDDTDEENYQRMNECFPPKEGLVRFYTSLSDAYDATESNNNDVILLDANSSHVLTTGLAVSKSRVHFIGMDGGDRLLQQGAKVQTTDAAAVAYTLKNTGTRNSFRNIKFIMNDTDAAALNVVQDGGEGTVWKNCSFVFGVADNLGGTTAHEFLAGTDSGTFLNCTFGNDTLLTSDARSVFHIDQVTASQEFKSNILRDCVFQISSSSATATFISLAAAGDILFSNLFDRCNFVASIDSAGGAALTRGIITPNGVNKGTLNFNQCGMFGATDFGTNGTNNDGLLVFGSPMASATDLVGLAPVAT
jgi:hypothetical protein